MLSSLVDAVRDKNKFAEAEQRLSSQRKKPKKKSPSVIRVKVDACSADPVHPMMNLSQQTDDSDDDSGRVVFRQVTAAGAPSKTSEGARMPPLLPPVKAPAMERPPKSKLLFEAMSNLPSVTAAEPTAAQVKPPARRRKKLVDTEVSPTVKMRGTGPI